MRVELPSPTYQSVIVSSSGDSDVEDVQAGSTTTEEDVNALVGVSISRVQTRLKSPTTPAAEKAAALNSLWGDGSFDPSPPTDYGLASHAEVDPSNQGTRAGETCEHAVSSLREPTTPIIWPTPWISGPKLFETHPSLPQQHDTAKLQPPSGTGPMGNLVDLNVKRFVSSFAMPSSPRPPFFKETPLLSFSSLAGKVESPTSPRSKAHRRSVSDMSQNSQRSQGKVDWFASKEAPWERNHSHALKQHGKGLGCAELGETDAAPPGSILDHHHHPPRGSLKRTISDQSLALGRATSIASSLGDDSRWEHVQKQVNSRAKAISDSLQDSKIKLPSLPSLSTVNLKSLRPDFLRDRASSDTIKPSWSLGSARDALIGSNDTSLGRWRTIKPQVPQPGKAPVEGSKPSIPAQESDYPQLDQALESLTGDLVIMGGYRGSILRSAKPPHRQLWVPIKVGLNIRKVNLEVGLEPEAEEKMEENIKPSGMLSHIGPVDMGRRLLKRLNSCRNAREGKLRVRNYGYDWRLSPHLLSRQLVRYLEQLPSNASGVRDAERGAIVIAHSLGGLITRHAVNQRPELFAGVVYAGVPQHCVNILGPLRKGDEVLLSSKVLTAQVNFTFRTSFLLLPEDGRCFIDKQTKEEYQVDFFNAADWKTYAFSPCIAPALPPFMPAERKGLFSFVTDNLPSLGRIERMPVFDAKTNTDSLKNASKIDIDPHLDHQISSFSPSPAAQSTIPVKKAEEYLERTLAAIFRFRDELKWIPQCAEWNVYPPLSILYSNSVPTVYGARVASRAAIKCSNAYDDLAFASGDGVCLARAAMLPKGYKYAPGGKIKTERGHVGLLGDLEAVGRCLMSVVESRRKGVGLGPTYRESEDSQKS
ncbi:MAG: hypothetical protein L6R39_005754 [Caloplaca ligustica]|nr:MAG: hypothetical protein L6R39_005754 [Caloplaca ligustica]